MSLERGFGNFPDHVDMDDRSFQLLVLLSEVIVIAIIVLEYYWRQNRVPAGTKKLPGPKGTCITIPEPSSSLLTKYG